MAKGAAKSAMRIVFCGSGTFAVPSLDAILASEHVVAAIVTQPARPAGRGGHLRATPVAGAAEQAGLQAWQCGDINEPRMIEKLGDLAADLLCVVDFGQMIRRPVRQLFRLDAINLHGSLLPALRGAAPVNWALIRGHERTGVTTFSLVDRMDAGPMYDQLETDIKEGETADQLTHRLARLGAECLCRTLGRLAGGQARPKDQDESKASLAPLLSKTDGLIDWSADARRVCGLIRGVWPWPGGQTRLCRAGGKDVDVVIARAAVAEGDAPASAPGLVDDELCVAAGAGRVRIQEIKPVGKRLMAWHDFVNGYRPRSGDQFLATRP